MSSLDTFIQLLHAWCRMMKQGRLVADPDCGLCAVCQVVLSEQAGLEEGGALEGILEAAGASAAAGARGQEGVVRLLLEVARGQEVKRSRGQEEEVARDSEEVDRSAKARRDMEGIME